jgi:pimeloyl-ACP methyl ester carboxylesterase
LTRRPGKRTALTQRFSQNTDLSGNLARLAKINVPTLIIWGGRDGLIPPAYAQQFEAAIKGSQVVMFEELGHVPQEEGAQATVAAVQRFLGN